jgi:hypothetical protein
MLVHGRCHCGDVTFEAEANPDRVVICHCTDCQSNGGSAFRVNIPVPGATFRLLSGEPRIYIKTTADSGNPRAQAFCPTCGTPVFATTPGSGPQETYVLRVGVLHERDQLVPRQQIWVRSAQPWTMQESRDTMKNHEKGA